MDSSWPIRFPIKKDIKDLHLDEHFDDLPTDKRRTYSSQNKAKSKLVHWANNNGRISKFPSEMGEVRKFVDYYISNKSDFMVPVQCISRYGTELDRYKIGVENTENNGWIWDSEASYVVFVDEENLHFVKMNELRNLVVKLSDFISGPVSDKCKAFYEHKIHRESPAAYFVYIKSEELETLSSYRRFNIVEDKL